MKLSKWYDFYFEHHGICPECGAPLFMHLGCYVGGAIFPCKRCSIEGLAKCESGRGDGSYFRFLMRQFRSKNYKRKKKNLDIQRKKFYIKTDN